ncbi:aspartate kinase [Psychrobacillus vulpis]|uniref:aspartate kinase n=1 Tax=Psychrobacillus vulpis TaxID=2325572 RepID=A0A544TK66_9BACI|nr:aspartate kinase [Psychrobacillus vulpis]TQR17845.1 aspartate kinase [Psychrobacillus vulpis]
MIVQKYGGIAMQDRQSRQLVIARIQKALINHQKVLVVVSAMGRKGQYYSTDSLLDLIPRSNDSVESDLLSACGELISASVLCAELKKEGVPATLLYGKSAGIITNEAYGNADILKVDTNKLLAVFHEFPCIIVPGFQGISEHTNTFTTLGRGGSDLTAVVYGHHLNAEVVEFYKNVPGVMTSDPFQNKSVQLITTMSYEELQKIIIEPVEIIQKKAAKFAALHKVPLHIRSLYEERDGTFVFH